MCAQCGLFACVSTDRSVDACPTAPNDWDVSPVQLSVFSISDALIRTLTPGSPETIEGKMLGFASRDSLHARKLEFTVCGYVMWVFGLVECRSLRIRLARCVLRPLWSHSGLRCASTTLVGIDVCVLIENFECLCLFPPASERTRPMYASRLASKSSIRGVPGVKPNPLGPECPVRASFLPEESLLALKVEMPCC